MNLKAWRRRTGTSAQELARQLELGVSTINAYENGSRRPRPEIAKAIEAATNGEVTAAELLGLSHSTTRPGLREEPAEFASQSADKVAITVPANLLDLARSYGLDVESLIAEGGLNALRHAAKEIYIERNKAAIEWSRDHVLKHGTPSEQLGMI